jgi:hypothetical protein
MYSIPIGFLGHYCSFNFSVSAFLFPRRQCTALADFTTAFQPQLSISSRHGLRLQELGCCLPASVRTKRKFSWRIRSFLLPLHQLVHICLHCFCTPAAPAAARHFKGRAVSVAAHTVSPEFLRHPVLRPSFSRHSQCFVADCQNIRRSCETRAVQLAAAV